MTSDEENQVRRLLEHVESSRPSWRLRASEEASGHVMVAVHSRSGGALSAPLSLNVEQIMSDFWGSGREIIRTVERRIRAGIGWAS